MNKHRRNHEYGERRSLSAKFIGMRTVDALYGQKKMAVVAGVVDDETGEILAETATLPWGKQMDELDASYGDTIALTAQRRLSSSCVGCTDLVRPLKIRLAN